MNKFGYSATDHFYGKQIFPINTKSLDISKVMLEDFGKVACSIEECLKL